MNSLIRQRIGVKLVALSPTMLTVLVFINNRFTRILNQPLSYTEGVILPVIEEIENEVKKAILV